MGDNNFLGGKVLADLGEGWTLVEASLFNRERGDIFQISHDANAHQRFISDAFSLDVLLKLGDYAQTGTFDYLRQHQIGDKS